MRGKGHLLISTFLLFFLGVLAQNTGTHANGGSDSDDGKVRVMSSTLTSPSVSSSSSSSSAAVSVPAAKSVTLDKLPVQNNFVSSGASTHFLPVFASHAHKLPLRAIFSNSPNHVPKNTHLPLSSTFFSDEGQDEIDLSPEKLEENSHGHHQQQNHRVKRGGYNAPYFVGKRSLEESEDLEQEELQKRGLPNEDMVNNLPKLQLQPDSVELEEEDPSVLMDKRRAPMFVGKRRAPFFVGKRRAPFFVGKRSYIPAFGEQNPILFATRAAPMFVGRRQAKAPMFIGRRAAAPMFVGKRAAAPMFVGKRAADDLNELLAALHTLQAARHYRRMIQADKRHNAPFFVGRRSSPQADGQPTDKAPKASGNYFR